MTLLLWLSLAGIWTVDSPASSTSKTKTIGATASSGFSAGKTAAHTWCWATYGAFGSHPLGLKLKMNNGALPQNEPVSQPKNGCPHLVLGGPWCLCIPWVQCCKRTKKNGALPQNEPVSLPKNGCPHLVLGDTWTDSSFLVSGSVSVRRRRRRRRRQRRR